jgi:hypothetical protein
MPVVPDAQTTLLSFLYHVSYNRSVNNAFHNDPDSVMRNDFNLPQNVRDVFRQLGQLVGSLGAAAQQQRAALITQLMGFLSTEITNVQDPRIW